MVFTKDKFEEFRWARLCKSLGILPFNKCEVCDIMNVFVEEVVKSDVVAAL